MAVRPVGKLTYEDYCAFPDDDVRRELIDGEVFVSPSPGYWHQRVLLRLAFELEAHIRRAGGGKVMVAPLDVVLSQHDVVEPDVLYLADKDRSRVTRANIQGPPTLVAEVVSDSRRDRRIKAELYGRFGVPEYWIVDPEADRVEILRLGPGGYGKPEIRVPGESLATDLIPGLVIDLADLFRPED